MSDKISLEDRFVEIAEEAIGNAERVPCPLPDFQAGLTTMIDVLQDRLVMLEDELKHR